MDKFHTKNTILFSAPGRTEIIGNHTDHQRGCVAAVRPNGENQIRLFSEGCGMEVVGCTDCAAREAEKNSSAALIRGI